MPKHDKASTPSSLENAAAPRPRVRRGFDLRPLQQRAPELKVRPFEEWFQYENGSGAFSIRGRLEGEGFVVVVSDLPPLVLSSRNHRDASGDFALLSVGRYPLAPRRLLCVELDAQDTDSDYTSIVYRELYGDCDAYEREGAAVRSYSVFFNPTGESDGTAATLPRSIRPPAAPS